MKTAEKQEKCADRISAELKDRLDTIKDGLKTEEGRIELEEGILEVAKSLHYKILLSTGGPEDYFVVVVNPEDHEVDSIEYHFRDWFDGATLPIRADSPEWHLIIDAYAYLWQE